VIHHNQYDPLRQVPLLTRSLQDFTELTCKKYIHIGSEAFIFLKKHKEVSTTCSTIYNTNSKKIHVFEHHAHYKI
jgi:hypothetical protein